MSGGGGGGVHITTRAHIASDMGPGKGSRIPRDMGPPGTISLAIWYRGGSTKGGAHIATTPEVSLHPLIIDQINAIANPRYSFQWSRSAVSVRQTFHQLQCSLGLAEYPRI